MLKQGRTFMLLAVLLLSACVTTTITPYEDKKDLAKAERSYIQIGYGYFEQNNLLEAKKALVTALDINPKSPGAHMGLARVYDRELEFDLAEDHFRKAIKYGGGSEANFQFGVYLYNRGDYKSAFREFNKVLQDTIYVRRPQAFEYQAVVANRLNRIDEAIGFYRKAIALSANLPNSYIGLARIYMKRSDYVNAYRYYKGFIRLVRAKQIRHNASTLWLGIQLAARNNDINALSSMELQLKGQFDKSAEYKQYLKWKSDQGQS